MPPNGSKIAELDLRGEHAQAVSVAGQDALLADTFLPLQLEALFAGQLCGDDVHAQQGVGAAAVEVAPVGAIAVLQPVVEHRGGGGCQRRTIAARLRAQVVRVDAGLGQFQGVANQPAFELARVQLRMALQAQRVLTDGKCLVAAGGRAGQAAACRDERWPSSVSSSGAKPISLPPLATTLAPSARAVFVALMGLASAPPALAQAAPSADAARRYDVPAGPLGLALGRFAAQAGVVLSFDAQLTQGKQSAGLQGDYGIASGLAAMLAGTGLEAVSQGGNNYGLRVAGAQTLAPVEVLGSREPAPSEGTDSYTVGLSTTATKLPMTLRA
ncbi:hypothetical protein G6F22_006810 [Rhizopus arrhizus]|nr:hypothetical protein G6F22_006810 [Rhizopus arrhizus]